MDDTTSWLTAGAALIAVLAALALLARVARATGLAPRANGRLAVEESMPLDARRRLLLVRCEGRHVLLVAGGAETVVVGWLQPGAPQ
jgi:flagellar protein FliO/FliZ